MGIDRILERRKQEPEHCKILRQAFNLALPSLHLDAPHRLLPWSLVACECGPNLVAVELPLRKISKEYRGISNPRSNHVLAVARREATIGGVLQ
jgi:hypothetical protein